VLVLPRSPGQTNTLAEISPRRVSVAGLLPLVLAGWLLEKLKKVAPAGRSAFAAKPKASGPLSGYKKGYLKVIGGQKFEKSLI